MSWDTIDVTSFSEVASAPKRARTQEGTIEERSIDELIKADQYEKAAAANAPPWGMRVARIKPRGTCHD